MSMKKILDGIRYDTDRAVEIGSADNCCRGVDSVTDFGYWQATLYRTPRSGRFFIAGHGGPMSRFAQSCGQNCWRGGEDLIPMTREEALEWAELWLTTEQVEAGFAETIEDA